MIKTGNKNFWICQIIGWGIMALANFLVQFSAGVSLDIVLGNTLIPFGVGFFLTTSYRFLIKDRVSQIRTLGIAVLWFISSAVFLTSLLLVFTFAIFSLLLGLPYPTLPSLLNNFIIFGLLMLVWNLSYFIIHYINSWHQAELDKWKLASEMKDAQLGSLKSQINPHFVFNTINNIRSLILEDKEKARAMLVNFSDLFRYSLSHTDQAMVSLEQELIMVRQYHELLSIQFEDKLDFQLKVDPDLEQLKIPPMMLQLLVENAIKHGISQFKNGGLVHIQIEHANNYLEIHVKNSGVINSTNTLGSKLGVGIQNIRKRLELLYNGRAHLNLKEQDNFVTATIQIPIS